MRDLLLYLLLGPLMFHQFWSEVMSSLVDLRSRARPSINKRQTGKDKLNQAERIEFIDTHNHWRSTVKPPASSMQRMYWSSELETVSQTWANGCRWGNIDLDLSKNRFKELGQNIYRGGQNITEVVAAWANELINYKHETNSCESICEHYTQVVWGNSYILGCGMAYCSEAEYFYTVCNYYHPGNQEGRSPYEGGKSCSKCPNGEKSCKDNLCDTVMKNCSIVETSCSVSDKKYCLCDKFSTSRTNRFSSNKFFILSIVILCQHYFNIVY